ncbi:MAG: hypothetical protein AAGU06_01910 [Candidatus Shapirobacteria bacterium]
MKLSERTIAKYSKMTDDELIDEISFALYYKSIPENVLPQPCYEEVRKAGIEFIRTLRNELYDRFCDRETRTPNKLMRKILEGDYKDILVAIVTTITSAYRLNLAIALPVAILIAKNKLKQFCSFLPTTDSNANVKDILLEAYESKKQMSGVLYQSKKEDRT